VRRADEPTASPAVVFSLAAAKSAGRLPQDSMGKRLRFTARVCLAAYALQLFLALGLWFVPLGKRVEPDGTIVIYRKGSELVLNVIPMLGLVPMLSPADGHSVYVIHARGNLSQSLDVPLKSGIDSLRWDADDLSLINTDGGYIEGGVNDVLCHF
jgi:hypothetical protein